MAKEVKLVAESLQEWENISSTEQLNESSKGALQKFLKAPEKYPKTFLNAFAKQFSKKGGDKLKEALNKLSVEDKVKIAKQSLEKLKDPKFGYAWVKILNGKISGGSALPMKGKEGLMSEVGSY
jgi:hypothetical protein